MDRNDGDLRYRLWNAFSSAGIAEAGSSLSADKDTWNSFAQGVHWPVPYGRAPCANEQDHGQQCDVLEGPGLGQQSPVGWRLTKCVPSGGVGDNCFASNLTPVAQSYPHLS